VDVVAAAHGNRDVGAAVRMVRGGRLAVMGPSDGVDDRQAESGSRAVAVAVGTAEALERVG
jgi:hypothetical protein